uniref:Uncharacterized protein n=1 Tax=Glossina austeni TaxID=7395 RepID=A0A1A9UDZ3_GLOAU
MLNPYTVALCLIVANEAGLMVWTNLKIGNALHNHSLLTQPILVDCEVKPTIGVTIAKKEKQYKQVEKLKDSCSQREANKSYLHLILHRLSKISTMCPIAQKSTQA